MKASSFGLSETGNKNFRSFQELLELVISVKCMHSRYPHKTPGIKNSCKIARSSSTPSWAMNCEWKRYLQNWKMYLSELQNVSLSIAKFICPNCRVHIYFYIHKFTNALSPLPSWRVILEWQCKQLHLQVPVGCNIEKISVKFVLYCLSRCQWGATGHVKKISGR